MSVSMNNLFNFSRALPEPFDKLVSKKVKVTSKYGSATEATLSCTVIKAVHAVCNCMVGTGEGAVGTIDHRTVAEYKSSAGPDMYHLVVFDSGSGNIMASIYDNNTETNEHYKVHQSAQAGAAGQGFAAATFVDAHRGFTHAGVLVDVVDPHEFHVLVGFDDRSHHWFGDQIQ